LPAEAGEPVALALEIAPAEGRTRIVIRLDRAIDFNTQVLANPYRLVVDIPELRWQPSVSGRREAGPVIGWRYGMFTRTRARLVFDLDRPMRIAHAAHSNSDSREYRLSIDLEPVSKEQFARDAAGERGKLPSYTKPDSDERKAGADPGGKPLIVLDPGHGGIDPGSTGPSGIHEKDLILSFTKDLRDALLGSEKYRVVLTRNGDYYIALRQRYEMARAAQATLFVSLHADASPFRGDRGISVYTLSLKASDSVSAELAKRENRSDAVAGVSLADNNERVAGILVDLAQRQSMLQAVRLAGKLLPELRRVGALVPGKAHRSAGFAVLKAPDVPSVLIEVGHLSNPKEEKLLQDPAYRAKLAAGILRGIDSYVSDRARAERRAGNESAER
jgi:N-acetylmuramoyl-L-alanine amidase